MWGALCAFGMAYSRQHPQHPPSEFALFLLALAFPTVLAVCFLWEAIRPSTDNHQSAA